MRNITVAIFAGWLSGCLSGTDAAYTIDSTGKITNDLHLPPRTSRVESIRVPASPDDAYRMLMLRCAAAEAEAEATSRRAYATKIGLAVSTVVLSATSVTLIGLMNSSSSSASTGTDNTATNLRTSAEVFGVAGALFGMVLATVGTDGQRAEARSQLRLIRQARDRVRAGWLTPDVHRPALLAALADACGADGMTTLDMSTAERGLIRPDRLPQ